MRAVKRWRYYCDFCKKAGNSGGHMKRHESGCTMNPARECRHCEKLHNSTTPMAAMLALLPDAAKFVIDVPEMSFFDGYETQVIEAHQQPDDERLRQAVEAALPALRELTDNCPTCILAALRQKRIPVPMLDAFSYSEELKKFWERANDIQYGNEPSYY